MTVTVKTDKDSPIVMPESRYPTGWLQVGWSADFAPGTVRSIRSFNQDIVIWRTESGKLHALDAYCLHLGANLGVGGKVLGEDVQCPFHGWQWNGDGENTFIPFSSQQCKPRLRIKRWHILDWYGCLVLWHDLADREPLWQPEQITELEDATRYPIAEDMRATFRIKAHPQMVLENGPDAFHVGFVHGGEPGETVRFEPKGHRLENELAVEYGSGKSSTWLTPGGRERMTVTASISGIGLSVLRWSDGFFGAINFTNVTPVDDVYSDYYWAMTVRRTDDAEGPSGRARRVIDHQWKTIQQDFPIWENMKVVGMPNFAPEEAQNFSVLRRWARQFYPDLVAS